MAAETGINPRIIRNLNRVEIIDIFNSTKTSIKDGKTAEVNVEKNTTIFSGYLLSPVGTFDAEVKTKSLNDSLFNAIEKVAVSGFGGKSGLWGAVAAGTRLMTAAGQQVSYNLEQSLQNGILYDRQYTLTGTNEFSKQFSCMLVTENDFFEDVIEPLYKLLTYVIPSTGGHINETKFAVQVDAAIKSANFGENWQWAKDLLVKTWETAKDYVGDVWTYKKSDMLMPSHKTNIKIGDYITINDVLINKISFDIPELLYEGGLFDHVKVNFTVTGKRNVSLDTFNWIKVIQSTRETFDAKNKQSLNSQFK